MKNNNEFINDILKLAEQEMINLNHPYVGSEHLILALLKNSEIKKICTNYDLTYQHFKKELISIIGKSNIKSKTVLHTPLLKTIINEAKKDAKENNQEIVTPYHLFISVLENGDGIGLRILMTMNIDLDSIYKDLKKELNPIINEIKKFGRDLSINDTILIGRDKEMETITEILLRKNKNNPILVGESGVGKTAIVEGLATLIKNNKIKQLKNYKIFYLDMSLILSGSKYRGDFEERLNNIIKQTIESNNIILFIDEIHTIINAGGSEGAIDAANILKPYLSKGEIKIIGATTKDEYEKFFTKDKALMRRFEKVYINEPTEAMTKDILLKLKNNYKEYYSINITNKNIDDILYYSNNYILDKFNPDKSLDVLDTVCSYVKNNNKTSISKKDIEEVISRKINRKLKLNTAELIYKLKQTVYGQNNAIESIVNIINKNKPQTTLLTGGIGVGKTILVENLSKELNINFININMSEYSRLYSINNIYDGDNSIYNKLNNNSIVLFDNIEKANKDVLNSLLKIIKERKIKDKVLNNTQIFLSLTNNIEYKIGFNKEYNNVNNYNNDILDVIDNIIKFDNINEIALNKYIKDNNIKDFDYTMCDYKNYGFRGVKILINTKNLIK